MPFVIIIIGVMVLLSAIKGSYQAFGNQIAADLQGQSTSATTGKAPVGYIYWVSSIVAIGLVGYYSPLQKFSRTFMLLILVGMVLANRGLFQQLSTALKAGPQQSAGSTSASAAPSTATGSIPQSQISSGNNMLSTAIANLAAAE